jgi:hypothetical protein
LGSILPYGKSCVSPDGSQFGHNFLCGDNCGRYNRASTGNKNAYLGDQLPLMKQVLHKAMVMKSE